MFVQLRAVKGTGALSLVALIMALGLAPKAQAQAEPSASDARAEFRPGNVTTCDALAQHNVTIPGGLPGNIRQISGGEATGVFGSPFIRVTVASNVPTPAGVAGPAETGLARVEITQAGIAREARVFAVVVKGGPAFNAYVAPGVLPPGLQPPQNYISPRNPGGNVAAVSHWFVCYTVEPPGDGTIAVNKTIQRPVGKPVHPLPDAYSVRVTCSLGDKGVIKEKDFTFGSIGGDGTIEGTDRTQMSVHQGARCRVREITQLPAGCHVHYEPPAAHDPGVRIKKDQGVEVEVVNDCRDVDVVEPRPEPEPEQPPILDVDKIVLQGVVQAGKTLRYTIVVTNDGLGLARNVSVCDRLPRDMVLVSAPGSRLRNGQICWRIARLRPLEIRRLTLIARARPRASGPATNVVITEVPGIVVRATRTVTIRPRRAVAPSVTG